MQLSTFQKGPTFIVIPQIKKNRNATEQQYIVSKFPRTVLLNLYAEGTA